MYQEVQKGETLTLTLKPTFSIDDLLPLQPVSIASEEVFEPKWAIRPGHGKMYGKKYILVSERIV